MYLSAWNVVWYLVLIPASILSCCVNTIVEMSDEGFIVQTALLACDCVSQLPLWHFKFLYVLRIHVYFLFTVAASYCWVSTVHMYHVLLIVFHSIVNYLWCCAVTQRLLYLFFLCFCQRIGHGSRVFMRPWVSNKHF